MPGNPTHDQSIQALTPKATCPQCGTRMRLAFIEPEKSDHHNRMTFDCACGFEYRMSERARTGASLAPKHEKAPLRSGAGATLVSGSFNPPLALCLLRPRR